MKLPVYARGLCSNGCNKDGPGEVGAIIACGGVAVRSGDIIIADRDGVAVVPLDAGPEIAKLRWRKWSAKKNGWRKLRKEFCFVRKLMSS